MKKRLPRAALGLLILLGAQRAAAQRARPCISGVYPHLAMANSSKECGVGAVVPWAGRLWVITYAPHAPRGSDDKLYEIDEHLERKIRPESVGGTPANRMVHRESRQLNIGPYFIDTAGGVRAIPAQTMPGRLTATARHLFDPAHKLYLCTMEEGLYEVDVRTLAVKTLLPDGESRDRPLLPGYHGKGAYTAQHRLVVSNNGEYGAWGEHSLGREPSGCLAQWDGRTWQVVDRNQYTEITGPGGIYGNRSPGDPLWALGWDFRSLKLLCLDDGVWHTYRLPKASHTYDGRHGWHTEWPRIRDIGQAKRLMTMHGMFFDFPPGFRHGHSAGIRPRSSYLHILGDFCRWGERIAMGCDDVSMFDNPLAGSSHSNLWFVAPGELDRLGPREGIGSVWADDEVAAGVPSDPFLLAGFDRRVLHIEHDAPGAITFRAEIDRQGRDRWTKLMDIEVAPHGYAFRLLSGVPGEWIRLIPERDAPGVSASFHYSSAAPRASRVAPAFARLARPGGERWSAGLIRPRGGGLRCLHFAAWDVSSSGAATEAGYYELHDDLQLARVDDPKAHAWLEEKARISAPPFQLDAASAILSAGGQRFRLPRGGPGYERPGPLGWARARREVVTERSLLNCCGTFFELPRDNAGGIAKIKPVATHNRLIHDFCSWHGLTVLSGVALGPGEARPGAEHIVTSPDGRAALWLGTIDDLWKLGKPRGHGGPWKDTQVKRGIPSEPYLMRGYDRKTLTLSQRSKAMVHLLVEVDLSGEGCWVPYRSFEVPPAETITHRFPAGYSACWLRVRSDRDTTASAQLVYD